MLSGYALRFTALAAAATLFILAAAAPDQVKAVRRTTVNWNCAEATVWHCQEYMMEEAVRRGGGVNGGVSGGRREVDLEMCCCKLKQMEAAAVAEGSTVCSVVEEAMQGLVAEQKRRGEVIMGEEELKNAWDVAEELPGKCGVVNSPSKCRFNRRFTSYWL